MQTAKLPGCNTNEQFYRLHQKAHITLRVNVELGLDDEALQLAAPTLLDGRCRPCKFEVADADNAGYSECGLSISIQPRWAERRGSDSTALSVLLLIRTGAGIMMPDHSPQEAANWLGHAAGGRGGIVCHRTWCAPRVAHPSLGV